MPDYTAGVSFAWEKYLKINKGCDSIGYESLESYMNTTGDYLSNWEIDLFIDLDIMRRKDG